MAANATGTDGEQRRCYLFEMPKELRLIVYEFLVDNYRIEILSQELPASDDKSGASLGGGAFFAKARGGSALFAAVRTCKQIYEEAYKILVQPQELVLLPASVPSGVVLKHLGYRPFDCRLLTFTRNLTKLELRIPVWNPASAAQELADSRKLAGNLGRGLKLKELQFGLHVNVKQRFGSKRAEHMAALLETWSSHLVADEYKVELAAVEGCCTVVVWERPSQEAWKRCEGVDEMLFQRKRPKYYEHGIKMISEAFRIPSE